ncbi:MAG TPA: ankyrin repeat domain-containing protein [Terriglobia bacterium]|nr:ankyrin repeat domain-containing protein [Terriglobia bacterium]
MMRRACCWTLWVALGLSGVMSGAAGEPLIDAVKHNDIDAARRELRAGAVINATELDGSTALHWAVRQNNVEMARLLLDSGADPAAGTRYGITPLYLAASDGNADIIRLLLRAGVDPNRAFLEGQTPLMTAARNGRPDAVSALLAAGARVDDTEPLKGQTALMWAAGEGNAGAIRLLVDARADLSEKSRGGYTALLFSVLNERMDATRALLEMGANANDVAPDGTSALNMAAVNAYYDVASLLLDFGADPNAKDPRGSALHTLAWLRKPGASGSAAVGNELRGPPVSTSTVTSLELAEQLLARGANPDTRVYVGERRFSKTGGASTNPSNIELGRHILTYDGATPFWLAANNGDIEYMRLLLAHGADGMIPNKFGVTPLMVAAGLNYYEGETPGPFTGTPEDERLEAVKLALEAGNDLNARADFGDYVMRGDPKYIAYYYPLNIEQLLDLGVGDPRWDGSTALHGAVVSGQPSIVKFLIERGARLDAVNDAGWTPLLLSQGFFLANAEKVYPEVEKVLIEAYQAQGLYIPDRIPVPRPIGEDGLTR